MTNRSQVPGLFRERILAIDAMRGLAILGIFLVNMQSYALPIFYVNPMDFSKTDLDRFVFGIIDVLVQASFYPLFAILFGCGLTIMYERAKEREQNFTKISLRRMGILLLFGMIHAFFLWPGDILIIYGVFGFLLILIVKMEVTPKALMIFAIILYSVPCSLFLLLYHALFHFGILSLEDLYEPEAARSAIEIYSTGSFLEITEQRIFEWFLINAGGIILLIFMVFPLLMIGVSLARSGKFIPSPENKVFFRKLLYFTFPVGIFFKLTPYLFPGVYVLEQFQDLFGGPILTFAYISLIYLLANSSRFTRIIQLFSAVGKLALSNYIFQSLISTFLFYSYGLGLFGTISYTECALIVMVIFLIQLIFSRVWLNHFRMGPLEWLWRRGTYGKIPNIKLKKESMS